MSKLLARLVLVVAGCAVGLLLARAMWPEQLAAVWGAGDGVTTGDGTLTSDGAGSIPAPVFPPFKPAEDHATFGYRLQADWTAQHTTAEFDVTVHTNANHLRGAEVPASKPADQQRVLVLGDSYSFGWGVSDEACFPALLDELADDLQVINAGVPGWSPAEHYVYLLEEGFDWEPDLVLLQLSTNDVADLASVHVSLGERNLPVAVEAGLDLTGEAARRVAAQLGVDEQTDLVALQARLGPERVFELINRERNVIRAERRGEPVAPGQVLELEPSEVVRGLSADVDFPLRYMVHLVDAMWAACRERGIPMKVLLVRSTPHAIRKVEPELEQWCTWRAECLDSNLFIPPDERAAYYFPTDPHWTEAGHRLAAEALARWLRATPR